MLILIFTWIYFLTDLIHRELQQNKFYPTPQMESIVPTNSTAYINNQECIVAANVNNYEQVIICISDLKGKHVTIRVGTNLNNSPIEYETTIFLKDKQRIPLFNQNQSQQGYLPGIWIREFDTSMGSKSFVAIEFDIHLWGYTEIKPNIPAPGLSAHIFNQTWSPH